MRLKFQLALICEGAQTFDCPNLWAWQGKDLAGSGNELVKIERE
jgi:hypothetical protein